MIKTKHFRTLITAILKQNAINDCRTLRIFSFFFVSFFSFENFFQVIQHSRMASPLIQFPWEKNQLYINANAPLILKLFLMERMGVGGHWGDHKY